MPLCYGTSYAIWDHILALVMSPGMLRHDISCRFIIIIISVTCHQAEVAFPPTSQPKLVLDQATLAECKAELPSWLVSYRDGIPTRRQSPISSNRARRGLTLFRRLMMLTTTLRRQPSGDSVDKTVQENSSVFSLIQMHWLLRACGSKTAPTESFSS